MTKNSNTRPRMRHVKWRVLLGKNMSEISNHACNWRRSHFLRFSAVPIYEEEAEWHTYFKVILMLKLTCFKWCLCLWLYTLFKGTRNGLMASLCQMSIYVPDGSMCQSPPYGTVGTDLYGSLKADWVTPVTWTILDPEKHLVPVQC